MYGKGILKGLSVTWKRFWDTYIEDISWLLRGKKPRTEAAAIAEDLLEYFNIPAARRDHYLRRLRLGVEYVYDLWLNTPRR